MTFKGINIVCLIIIKGNIFCWTFGEVDVGRVWQLFPEFGRPYRKELADSLVVISISSDNEKRWKESSKENGITWVSLSDKWAMPAYLPIMESMQFLLCHHLPRRKNREDVYGLFRRAYQAETFQHFPQYK